MLDVNVTASAILYFSNSEQGGVAFGGAGSKHQELGLLAQAHYADCLHHRRRQELLHTCAQSVSQSTCNKSIFIILSALR